MKTITGMLLGVLLSHGLATAQPVSIPLSYQGRLLDSSGKALSHRVDGYRLTFRIFNAQAPAGTLVWGPFEFDLSPSDSVSNGHRYRVPVVDGWFSVVLGEWDTAGNSLADCLYSPERFLEVAVDGGSPVVPRQRIISAPYAVRVDRALHGFPTGAIVAYWNVPSSGGAIYICCPVPQGWIVCDGSAVPAGDRYEALRVLVGDRVPDLRGMFLRGLNSGRTHFDGDTESRTIGSYQSDSMEFHEHDYKDIFFSANVSWGSQIAVPQGFGTGTEYSSSDMDNVGLQKARATDSSGGADSRPKNMAVTWLIKY
jgi:Phage Tail Collar Domain